MSTDKELIIYGDQSLTNQRFHVNASSDRSLSPFDVQTLDNTRSIGSSVVFSRNTERAITLSGLIQKDTSNTFLENLLEFEKAFRTQETFLRFIPDYEVITNTTSLSNWSAFGDATNLAINTSQYQYLSNSISFDIDVSINPNDRAFIQSNGGTPSAALANNVDKDGSILLWVFIENARFITNVKFRVGNSSTDYYQTTFTANYEGNPIKNGFNLFEVKWKEGFDEQVGTPNDALLDYFLIDINYQSSQEDSFAYIDGLLWIDNTTVRNYRTYSQNVAIPRDAKNVDYNNYTATFLAFKGYSQDLFTTNSVSETAITNYVTDRSVVLEGSLDPLPIFQVYWADATNVLGFDLQNTDNGQTISFQGPSTEDLYEFGGLNNQVLKNGQPVDFSGVIPEFKLGTNGVKLTVNGTSPTTQGNTTTNEFLSYAGGDPSKTQTLRAQQFTAAATGVLTQFDLSGYRVGPGPFGVQIFGDDGTDQPDNNTNPPLFTTTISPATTNSVLTVTGVNLSVTSGTKYWILVDNYNSGNGSAFYWAFSSSLASNTVVSDDNGANWSKFANRTAYYFITIEPAATSFDVDWNMDYRKLYI